MNLELALFDPTIPLKDQQQSLFLAEQKGATVAVQGGFTERTLKFVPPGHLTVVVDFPYGCSPTPLKLHAILAAANIGIKQIDIIANLSLAVNDCWDDFIEDLRVCIVACERRKIELAVVVDYRFLPNSEIIEHTFELLKRLGIKRVVSGAGWLADDFTDHILLARQLVRAGFDVTMCSTAFGEKTLEMATKVGVEKARILSDFVMR